MLYPRNETLSGYGLDASWISWLKMNIMTIALNATCYGLFLSLIIITLYVFFRQDLRNSRANQILLAVMLVMITISTSHLILNLLYFFIELEPLAATYHDSNALLRRMNSAQQLLRRVAYLLSDIIVVWRAWIIWKHNVGVRVFLSISIFGTAVTSVILAVLDVLENEKGEALHPTLEKNMLGTFGLLVTNFGATALIAYKAWDYRRHITAFLSESDTRTKVQNVFILLVESGVLYCIYWSLMLVDDFGFFGNFGVEWVQPHISGMYQTVIILLVGLQKTASETILSAEHRASSLSIAFARPAPTHSLSRIEFEQPPSVPVNVHKKDVAREFF